MNSYGHDVMHMADCNWIDKHTTNSATVYASQHCTGANLAGAGWGASAGLSFSQ